MEDLGRRHVGYGVADEHYDTVGAALLWTLEKGLGRAFTPEVKDAWATVYGVLATTMKNAAASEGALRRLGGLGIACQFRSTRPLVQRSSVAPSVSNARRSRRVPSPGIETSGIPVVGSRTMTVPFGETDGDESTIGAFGGEHLSSSARDDA